MEDLDLRSISEARRLVAAAAEAGKRLATLSQEQIDAIVLALHEASVREAESWARLALEETGFGNLPHKIAKNLFAARDVYEFIRPMRTVGVLRRDEARRLIEIAAPAGVVAAIVPSTNPTSTAINKILIALKAACPIVISPHPNARKCVLEVARVLGEAAQKAGAPPGSIACMSETSLPGTRELMQHKLTGVILATGGTGLVRAAYSSGKPAFGVGPGNVPAYVDRTADLAKAAADIVAGKTFDNGVLCSAENAVVADAAIDAGLRAAMEAQGARFLDEAEVAMLSRLAVTPAGALNTEIVGKSAERIAEMAGLSVPAGTRCLVAPLREVGAPAPLSREKLSPILAYYVEDGWEAGCARCLEILAYGGMGHTLAIHAKDRDLILKFGLSKPVFRIIVNSPSAVGAVGVTTGVDPSMTLGCGALGGNITSDNITPRHLVNVKRLAFETRPFESGPSPPAPARSPARAALPVAAAVPPQPVPGPLRTPQSIRERVEAALAGRQPAAAPAPAPSRPEPRIPAGPRAAGAPAPAIRSAVAFVCEADVRQALLEDRKIAISGKTIITPSARDLGTANRVFVQV